MARLPLHVSRLALQVLRLPVHVLRLSLQVLRLPLPGVSARVPGADAEDQYGEKYLTPASGVLWCRARTTPGCIDFEYQPVQVRPRLIDESGFR